MRRAPFEHDVDFLESALTKAPRALLARDYRDGALMLQLAEGGEQFASSAGCFRLRRSARNCGPYCWLRALEPKFAQSRVIVGPPAKRPMK